MSKQPAKKYATGQQFATVVLRWMPEWASQMPEAKLMANAMGQAWADGEHWFFNDDCPQLRFYCRMLELNHEIICAEYRKHNARYAKRLGLT